MMPFMYMTIDDAIEIHRKTVEVSGGGALGALDIGKLESVLEHIQNDAYYPLFEDKLTHLFFGACKFHCFQDGNKRIAITLSAQMLLLNGYLYCVANFLHDMENISYHVAAGRIGKPLLRQIISSHLSGMSDNEELKLAVLNAISQGE